LLPIYEWILGPEDQDTLTARGNLAHWKKGSPQNWALRSSHQRAIRPGFTAARDP